MHIRADLLQERWYDEDMIRGCRFITIFRGMLLFIPTVFNGFRLFYPVALPDRFYSYLSQFCIIGMSFTTFYKRRKRREATNYQTVNS